MLELMIVIAIVAVVFALSVPAFVRSRNAAGLRKGVTEVMEACNEARAHAILRGVPMEVVIVAEDGLVDVRPATAGSPVPKELAAEDTPEPNEPTASAGPPLKSSKARRLPDDVAIELFDVNFVNQMEFTEGRVRFFPNGSSDECTIVLLWNNRQRAKISLEVVTGLADLTYL
jgi:type II secretory pathway pseudopilin PulG